MDKYWNGKGKPEVGQLVKVIDNKDMIKNTEDTMGDEREWAGRMVSVSSQEDIAIDIKGDDNERLRFLHYEIEPVPQNMREPMTYKQIHEASGIEVGDTVKVVGKVESKDREWQSSWVTAMSDAIGNEYIVICKHLGGIILKVNDWHWNFPAHSLEIVKKGNEPINSEVADAIAYANEWDNDHREARSAEWRTEHLSEKPEPDRNFWPLIHQASKPDKPTPSIPRKNDAMESLIEPIRELEKGDVKVLKDSPYWPGRKAE